MATVRANSDDAGCANSGKQSLLAASSLFPGRGAGDLELRLLQAFSDYAGRGIVRSYAAVKNSSRVLGFVATSTETVVTKAGLVAIVRLFYNQYLRFGHPLVRYVDDAVGKWIVGAFVRALLAVEYQQSESPPALRTANGEPLQLTYYERIQALLHGQVPRLQAIVMELSARDMEAKNAPPPALVFHLEDYVKKEEVERLQQESATLIASKEHELTALKCEVEAAQHARQQLEQAMMTAEASLASQHSESIKLLTEKQQQITALKDKVQAAEKVRDKLQHDVHTMQAMLDSERNKILAREEVELAILKQQTEDAKRDREQLKTNLHEALTAKDAETREALVAKEQEVAALKNEVQAADMARKKLEEEHAAARVQMENEHKQRVQQLEEELARAKEDTNKIAHDLRATSLRQQRSSFDANLVKDYVLQARRTSDATPPVTPTSNQDDHDELVDATKPRTSSASSATSASPRSSNEEMIKAKLEKEKLNARMRRVLGSRF